MKISVIIPAHNEERYLGDTLRAILAQDHPDYEVIVVDNASVDRTAEIARSFIPMVRVLFEGRKGTMWACERGRQEASGEIIVRMDADCLPEKDWLSRGSAHFSDPGVSAVSGPYDYHDAGPSFRFISMAFQRSLYGLFNGLAQAFDRGGVIIGGNSFMKAAALEKSGGFNTELTFYGDDTDTAIRVSRHGRIIFSPTVVMKTSARRFKDEGVIRLQSRYIYHFFRVLAKRKSPSK